MWKLSRNFGVYYRWPRKQQKHVDNKSCPLSEKVLLPSIETKRSSDQDHKKKQHFRKNENFWSCDNIKFLLFKSTLLEKAGWLGTVTILGFNLHYKHFQFNIEHYQRNSHCLLSRNVFAVPEEIVAQKLSKKEQLQNYCHEKHSEEYKNTTNFSSNKIESHKLPIEEDSLDNFRNVANQYTAALYNSSAISSLKHNKKKAFRDFQNAARLGSSQAFYNLGLCFELGEGTKQNLSRAAFCYRKAAMNGHGLASFNLAVFFLKGLGGLPIDKDTAKKLLLQAANKGIPEAQLYIGLECIQEQNYSEAFQVFDELAKKNVLDGKYYLGICYEKGWGVHKNESIAVELFSEAAKSGHSKSVLKLSNCYEKGIGGCVADLDFSTALCEIHNDPKDKELNDTLVRLKVKKATLGNKKPVLNILSTMKEPAVMRTSASVPELKSYCNKPLKNSSKLLDSYSYLDLTTPLCHFKNNSDLMKQTKSVFHTEESKLHIKPFIPSMSFFNYRATQLMIAKS